MVRAYPRQPGLANLHLPAKARSGRIGGRLVCPAGLCCGMERRFERNGVEQDHQLQRLKGQQSSDAGAADRYACGESWQLSPRPSLVVVTSNWHRSAEYRLDQLLSPGICAEGVTILNSRECPRLAG